LFKNISGWTMARDLVTDLTIFPFRYALNRLKHPAPNMDQASSRLKSDQYELDKKNKLLLQTS